MFDQKIFGYLSNAISNKRDLEIDQGTTPLGAPPRITPELIQLEKDVLPLLIDTKALFTFTCDPVKDFWMQMKTGSSTLPANRAYLQYFLQAIPRRLSKSSSVLASPDTDDLPGLLTARTKPELIQPVYVHPTALVHPSARIGPNVSIGPRALISRGVRVKDSIILDNCEVRHDACVLNAVVGWDSKIGCWSRVEGAPLGESTHEDATIKGYKLPSAGTRFIFALNCSHSRKRGCRCG